MNNKPILALLLFGLSSYLSPATFAIEKSEQQQLIDQKTKLEQEATELRSNIANDKERLEDLQRQIELLRAKNGHIDSQLIEQLNHNLKLIQADQKKP